MADPADEAGGEVVYSSDGLSPVTVSKPPPVQQHQQQEEEAVLDSDDLAPETAFEVFQGKVYSTATTGGKSKAKNDESPVERLARLSTEVAELEALLKSSSGAASGKDFDEQLVELATQLKTRLEAVSNPKMDHDDLTRLMQQQLQALRTTKQPNAAAEGSSSTGVVYELYGTATNPTSTMESRIIQLERLLGSSQNQVTHNSLVSRLEELESLVQTVNPSVLEQTATKAKVIRADLEAASKARNKLTATYKKEDSKMIQQLHQQMVELEGLSGYLPSLVDRLQQLSGLHVQASTFSSRLSEVEKSANQLGATVTSLESTLNQVQTNMVENVQTMETNMKELDERLNKL
eukprot:scaffold2189_cov116-Cylindrotheca_fusiformis.AAC.9